MENQQGQIITFYSYKGGTGRSMALANVACILAQNKKGDAPKKVLMMDWDLEAPGLHRYFANRLKPRSRAKDSRGTGHCDAEPGLIDLFHDLQERLDIHPESIGEEAARKIFDETDLDRYIIPTSIEGLSLIKAGRFNPADTNEYPERVNKFSWETLYNKAPQLMRVFAEVLAERYDYVLIDSRTGVTDISGVCTMLLPEKLVIVFTPNMQSLLGAIDVVRRATDYRKESDDLRSLMIFPLVSRVESNEPDLRYNWRFGNPEKKITGYQREFEKVFREVYGNEQIELGHYFDEMQIQHIPRYAYGEEIAVLEERSEDKFSLKRSYKTFASKLVEDGLPWGELLTDVPPEQVIPETAGKTIDMRSATLFAVLGAAVVSILIAAFFGFQNYTQRGQNIGATTKVLTSSTETVINKISAIHPVVGTWNGEWSAPSGAYYTLRVYLNSATTDGLISGQVDWTLWTSSRPDKIGKTGKSAIEFIRGTYDQESKTLLLAGYDKHDPENLLVMLDEYKLILSPEGKTLSGTARNGGPWNASVNLTRDNQDGPDAKPQTIDADGIVNSPSGELSLQAGPGFNSPKITPIPNGAILHVNECTESGDVFRGIKGR